MSNWNKTYAQCGEDVIMLFLIRHVIKLQNCYYLDIGANDPELFNNTQLLYEDGINGLSIDANPYFAPMHKVSRPNAKYITGGIGEKSGKATFYEINPHTLSTFSEPEAIRYTTVDGHKLVAKHKVKIKTIAELIKDDCEQAPNILSLDVEGLDFQILQSIDFDAWRPAVICVETITYGKQGTQHKVEEVISFLKDHGYRIYADTYINTIFVDNKTWDDSAV